MSFLHNPCGYEAIREVAPRLTLHQEMKINDVLSKGITGTKKKYNCLMATSAVHTKTKYVKFFNRTRLFREGHLIFTK